MLIYKYLIIISRLPNLFFYLNLFVFLISFNVFLFKILSTENKNFFKINLMFINVPIIVDVTQISSITSLISKYLNIK